MCSSLVVVFCTISLMWNAPYNMKNIGKCGSGTTYIPHHESQSPKVEKTRVCRRLPKNQKHNGPIQHQSCGGVCRSGSFPTLGTKKGTIDSTGIDETNSFLFPPPPFNKVSTTPRHSLWHCRKTNSPATHQYDKDCWCFRHLQH